MLFPNHILNLLADNLAFFSQTSLCWNMGGMVWEEGGGGSKQVTIPFSFPLHCLHMLGKLLNYLNTLPGGAKLDENPFLAHPSLLVHGDQLQSFLYLYIIQLYIQGGRTIRPEYLKEWKRKFKWPTIYKTVDPIQSGSLKSVVWSWMTEIFILFCSFRHKRLKDFLQRNQWKGYCLYIGHNLFY